MPSLIRIACQPGEMYTYGFDFAPYLAATDALTAVLSVEQVAKSDPDAPDIVIGAVGLTSGKAAAEISVDAAAAPGTKYTVRCLADSRLGTNLRLDGILEVQ